MAAAALQLAGRSIASGVYFAVDDPAGDVAFIRFVPEVAQSSQVFESFLIRGGRFMTLERRPDGTWCVGLAQESPVRRALLPAAGRVSVLGRPADSLKTGGPQHAAYLQK
jgi:hypothetical protein